LQQAVALYFSATSPAGDVAYKDFYFSATSPEGDVAYKDFYFSATSPEGDVAYKDFNNYNLILILNTNI
jgi:hypothetical protein